VAAKRLRSAVAGANLRHAHSFSFAYNCPTLKHANVRAESI